MPEDTMSRTLSIYLDVVRFNAAIVVFLGHAAQPRGPGGGTGGLFWQFTVFSFDAVTIFFVLSGFVIAYVACTRDRSPRHFFTNRAARIYSVAVPAIVLTWALDYLGFLINPSFYNVDPQLLPTWLPFALCFLNDIWGAYVAVGSNHPYWSLGFEVWYYVLFGCALFAPRHWAIFGCLAMAVFLGPGIIILFPLWLGGAATYGVIGRISQSHEGVGWSLFLGSTILLGALFYWFAYGNDDELTMAWGYVYGVISNTGLAGDQVPFPRRYAVGVIFILNLVGFRLVEHRFANFLGWFENPIRWAAGMTFSVYLYHMPLLDFLAIVLPGTPSSMIHRIGMICISLLVITGIAQITERQKSAWRRRIDAVISTGLAIVDRRRSDAAEAVGAEKHAAP